MNTPHNKAVEDIIKELKQAKSLDEACSTLDTVQHLDAQSKEIFADRISSISLTQEFQLAAKNKKQPFHVLYVKALDDITKVKKPQFKILWTENNATEKRPK